MLNRNEIKISLSSEEMTEMRISVEDFDYDNTHSKRIIWELFDRAKEETGFDAAGDRVMVKLYPKRNGGCDLYVSKLSELGKGEDKGEECTYYLFSDLDRLLAFRKAVPAGILMFWRKAFPLINGKWILIMNGKCPEAKELLTEFSTPLRGEYVSYALSSLRMRK